MSNAFPDEDACINHFRALRWPDADNTPCPHRGVIGKPLHAQEQHAQVPRVLEEIYGPQRDYFRGQQDWSSQVVHGRVS